MNTEQQLSIKLNTVLPHLNEKQRRLFLAAEAKALGWGGISKVAQATGVSRVTIYKALEEIQLHSPVSERIRKLGAGRKGIEEHYPDLSKALESLVDPVTRGDPESPLRWTCKSTRQLAIELARQGYYRASHVTIAELLHDLDYSLQANAKTLEGSKHPDRDAQFNYINEEVKQFLKRGQPVISVDTKKKELVGNFKNPGREWQPKGAPEKVEVHDFASLESPKVIPYGIYDIGKNMGWINVGCDHDSASFAVASIRRWWLSMGKEIYPEAKELMICADGGGSNGYRVRLWKVELQSFATETGFQITTCHFPPGTSKWNKIEHRLFSHISMNWRGRPLVSHEVIVKLIGKTFKQQGLWVKAKLDKRKYPTKIKVSDQEMKQDKLKPHTFHGEWNYSIKP
ncbi:MAG: ISAzo13 family transposase [Desulfobacterales bacterium CG07_land_8_20_14_0_80_52_14]|nr:MAG: ISAzo13 family transposase [Desulfobacterales bacterium CG07_land_8_20_14_0_80_52_14]